MSELDLNPYDAPQSDLGVDTPVDGSLADLRNVASWQRALVLCLSTILVAGALELILASVAAAIPQRFASTLAVYSLVSIAVISVVVSLAALTAYVIGVFSIYRLSARLWGTILGAVLGIASVAVPVGLLMALVVHICTTRLLKSYGLQVGLLWTDSSEVERWGGDTTLDPPGSLR